MKIRSENNIRWLSVENESNFLYDIQEDAIAGKRLIPAKSITEENMKLYFKEITPKEVEILTDENSKIL